MSKWNPGGRVSWDPQVRGRRQDQTIAGNLPHQLGMKLTTAGLDTCSSGKGLIRRGTHIVIDRGSAEHGGVSSSLRRIGMATTVGALVPRLPRPTRSRA